MQQRQADWTEAKAYGPLTRLQGLGCRNLTRSSIPTKGALPRRFTRHLSPAVLMQRQAGKRQAGRGNGRRRGPAGKALDGLLREREAIFDERFTATFGALDSPDLPPGSRPFRPSSAWNPCSKRALQVAVYNPPLASHVSGLSQTIVLQREDDTYWRTRREGRCVL